MKWVSTLITALPETVGVVELAGACDDSGCYCRGSGGGGGGSGGGGGGVEVTIVTRG